MATIALPKVDIQVEIPKDSVAERNRALRWIVNGFIALIVLYAPYRALQYVGTVLDHPFAGSLFGLGLGIYILGLLVPRMLVNNPEWSAYVTQDPYFGGYQIAYGPGTHLSLPWEERNADGNFSLEVITREFSLTSPTKTSAVTITGRLFYNASLEFLLCAIGVDKEIVEEGQIAFIQSYLIPRLAGMSAENAIKQTTELGNELNDTFRDKKTSHGKQIEEFEKKLGYSTASIVIDKIAYPPRVQETFDALSEAKKMNEIAAKLMGVSKKALREMTPKQIKEMVDRAMALSGNAKMNVNVIEGEMGAAVANFLTEGKGGRS